MKIDERCIRELVAQFQNRIKHQFDPLDPRGDTELDLPIPGVQDIPGIGIRDGYMTFSK